MKIRSTTTLYFIRHGRTTANAQGIKQGIQIDDYLDTAGIMQVEQLAPIVSHLDLDILYTSYLHRAEESAAIINSKLGTAIPVQHDYRLRERDFGSLTGKTKEEILKALPDYAEKEQFQEYDYRPFGGESVEDVRQRALGAILDITMNNRNKNVGIVTHNGVIRLLLFNFPDIPRIYRAGDTSKDIGNCDIYEWEMTDGRIKTLKSLLQ